MKRLMFSAAGHLRSLQISRAALHVFVEGKDVDCYVYGKFLKRECPSIFEYKLTRADELPTAGKGGGGKTALDRFFCSLRRTHSLAGEFKGHKFTSLFFFDKDIDDITRHKRRSPHVVYTTSYDIEAEVFSNGDVADAVAAACYLDPSRVSGSLISRTWISDACNLWRGWVVLCIATKLSASNGVAGYGSLSQVNPALIGPVDAGAFRKYRARVENHTTLSAAEFARVWRRAEAAADRAYSTNNPGLVFKGKWFAVILEQQVKAAFPTEYSRTKSFKRQVTALVAQSADVNARWADRYRTAVRDLLTAI